MRFSAVAALIATSFMMAQARPEPARLDKALYAREEQCDIKQCAIDLAPTVAACGIAAAQAEVDFLTDAACISAAVETGTNFPAVCKGCPDKYKDKIPSLSSIHL